MNQRKLYKPKIKEYKNKYKVKLYTKFFSCPTSLSCESLFSTCYIGADNEDDLYERINKQFDGRKEIISFEKI